MKIVHVCAGAEANNGAAVIAAGFARAQARRGDEVAFAFTAAQMPGEQEVGLAGCRRVAYPRSRLPILRSLCWSAAMARELGELCRDADEVWVHCDWTFPVWWAARCAARRLVFVPEGSFDPVRLAHSAWKKRLVGVLDRRALCKADAIIALSAREAGWIVAYEPRVRGRVVRRLPVIDLPLVAPVSAFKPSPTARLGVLYLGRCHPLKGLDLLAAAAEGLPIDVRVETDLFGAAKDAAFAACDILCLPTRSENFGLVVAEALARGKPVLTTTAAPWEGLASHRCGWWVPPKVESLRAALEEAVRLRREMPEELSAMGRRGREWIATDFPCGQMEDPLSDGCSRRLSTGVD